MKIRLPQALMAATAAVLVFAASAQAQERPFEISLDGGLVFTTFDVSESATEFKLPFQQARLGVYVAPQWAVDGSILVDYFSQDDYSETAILLAPGLTYHFAPYEAGENRPYVSGVVAWDRMSFDTGAVDGSASQFGFGARVGTKLPVGEAGFVRLEGGYIYLLENEDDGREAANVFELSVGIGAIVN